MRVRERESWMWDARSIGIDMYANARQRDMVYMVRCDVCVIYFV